MMTKADTVAVLATLFLVGLSAEDVRSRKMGILDTGLTMANREVKTEMASTPKFSMLLYNYRYILMPFEELRILRLRPMVSSAKKGRPDRERKDTLP